MAYNVGDLTLSIRKRIKDLSFDSSLILEYIQEVNNEVSNHNKMPFMQVDDNDYIAVESIDYDLAANVETVLSVRLVDETTGNFILPYFVPYPAFYDTYSVNTDQTSVTPSFYTLFSDTIIWPGKLDRTYNMYFKYLKRPTTLTDDASVPDVPERFKEIILKGVLARVEDFRGNFDISAIYQRRYEDLVEDMLVKVNILPNGMSHKARFGQKSKIGW